MTVVCMAEKKMRTFCCLGMLFCFARGHEADPCLPTTYEVIDDSWRPTVNTVTYSIAKCDATLQLKWYRATSNATIPTTPPALYSCGTQYPLWMDDVLPNAGETEDVKMCLRTAFSYCQSEWNIRVKNCNTFYVYELQPTSTCPSAYCFGDQFPCPDGQTSANGFMPNCEDIPMNISDINLSANVSADLVNTEIAGLDSIFNATRIEFQCDIDVDSGIDLTIYWFDVLWIINDNMVETYSNVPYSTYRDDTGLQETSWTGTYRLGFLVKCGVRVRAAVNSVPGSYNYSEPFYAGIMTDASDYIVSEGGSVDVTVRLTVPVGCSYSVNKTPAEINKIEKNECPLRLRVRTLKKLDCTLGGVTDEPISFDGVSGYCGVTFPFLERNVAKKFKIFGSGDNVVNLDSRSIFIRMETDFLPTHEALSHGRFPDIHVAVTDTDIDLEGKLCSARTDPNMMTFDGRSWAYQKCGEYVMYKHDILPIRVHLVFDRGIWGGSCVCGVAIRNGDALFVVNLCRSKVGTPWISGSTNTNQYIEKRACDNTHMTVETKGSVYTVTLSSGTVVTISIRIDGTYTYVRYVQVKPSLVDWGSTTGLCGVLDGDKDNDKQKRDGSIATAWWGFGDDWKLNSDADGPSLFDVGEPLKDLPIPPLQYCRCRDNAKDWIPLSDHVICNLDSTVTLCKPVTDTSDYFTECDKAHLRKKKDTSAVSPSKPTKFGVVLDENYINEPDVYEWRDGWSEALARESCQLALGGDELLSKCKYMVPRMSESVEASEEECINDILVSANANFMKDTVEAMKTTCIVEAMRSENLTTKGSNNETGMTFLDELLELSCPNNCSGNGNCINGRCVCSSDMYGDECSLRKTTPPVITQAGTNGLCKQDESTCRSFVIPGYNFIDSQLTCKVRYIKVYSDRWETLDATDNFPATYLNNLNCICTIPSTGRKKRSDHSESVIAEGYLLSLSNDGVNFGNETTFIIYDATCYECNATNVSCTQLNSCPTTNIKNETKNDKDATIDVLQIIFIGAGTALFLGLLGGIILCCKQKKQRTKTGDSSPDVRQGAARIQFDPYSGAPIEDDIQLEDCDDGPTPLQQSNYIHQLDIARFAPDYYKDKRLGTHGCVRENDTTLPPKPNYW